MARKKRAASPTHAAKPRKRTAECRAQSPDTQEINVSQSDINAWAAAVDTVCDAAMDTAPEGWYTMRQLASDVFCKSLPQTSSLVRALRAAGRCEMKKFHVKAGSVRRCIEHYKLVT